MKISEKQIFQLIAIARNNVEEMRKSKKLSGYRLMVSQLLDDINNQQSDELKETSEGK